MLNRDENDLLARVGPGTPMGAFLRHYWMPACIAEELPEPDGAPMRLQLLGEDLIAWRNTDRSIGVMQNACPHRGASLFFGRNEENGLRCVYHGWKFDVSGACIDMPNEPAESNFKHKIKATAYTVIERGGVVWVFMGAADPAPALPAFEWNLLPPEQVSLSMLVQECNWAQAVEGGIDSSHVGFLHGKLGSALAAIPAGTGRYYSQKDNAPRFEVMDTEYGMVIGARRNAEDDSYYWRISQFLYPFYSMIPPSGALGAATVSGHAWVPMDDHHVMMWEIEWHPNRALTAKERERELANKGTEGPEGMLPPSTRPGGRWYPRLNDANDYGQDYELQRTLWFSGVPSTQIQDIAIQESMGTVYDRTKEHLGSSDTAIIHYRRRWIAGAKALAETGETPPGVTVPDSYAVRSASLVLPRATSWADEGRKVWFAKKDTTVASV
ncbi:MAG: aromatic ring-hydroxylating dioxygenase subunit alpha [Dehalococcoidia bacterium]|nr:aromatic ring-hydroxylating dioxygenase subunit alpha [Dehalococcoidia bacterium]